MSVKENLNTFPTEYHRYSVLQYPSFIMVERSPVHAPFLMVRLATTSRSRPVLRFPRSVALWNDRLTVDTSLTMRRALPLLEAAWACRLAIVGTSRRLRSPSLSISLSLIPICSPVRRLLSSLRACTLLLSLTYFVFPFCYNLDGYSFI